MSQLPQIQYIFSIVLCAELKFIKIFFQRVSQTLTGGPLFRTVTSDAASLNLGGLMLLGVNINFVSKQINFHWNVSGKKTCQEYLYIWLLFAVSYLY